LSAYLDLGEMQGDVMLNNSRLFGGNSSGTLAFDFDDDADLDVMVSNYDVGLFVFKNGLNAPNSAIQIFPEGRVSNRSAVGARVFLYRSGKMGQPDSLVGSRLIESANSYGCSPAKLAHFGVAPKETYNAKIIFPSGIVREVRGLSSGERRVVAELDGLAASMIKTRRALANLLFGYRSRQRLAVLCLGAILLAAVLWLSKKVLGLSDNDQKWLAIIFSASLLTCLILWFAQTQAWYVARPLLVSFGLTSLMIIVWRGRRLYQARPASIEMLQIRLNAFGHGSLIHQLMNRLALFTENLETGSDLPIAARQKLAEVVGGLQHFLNHEIRAILTYQYGNNFAMDLAFRLETVWKKFKKALADLQRQLAAAEKLDRAQFTAAGALQKQLREIIPAIQKQLSKSQRVEPAIVIADFIHRNDLPRVQLLAPPLLPPARITAEDLIYVLDELVQNALRHLDGRAGQIDIALRQHLDEVQVDISDNGKGIPENLWEEIFRFGFTTRPGGKGGFGLYHARQRIEKYGGKIFVFASEIGKGTTVRICLKTEKE
ncbi:MAG: ATP-binding protein, partial [bacterium]